MNIRKKIKDIVFQSPFLALMYARYYIHDTELKEVIWGGDEFDVEIDKYLAMKLTPNELSDREYVKRLTEDIVASYFLYGATPQEYFMFGFRNLNHRERKRYLTNKHKDEVMLRIEGWDSFRELEDKSRFFNTFESYFHREVYLLNEDSSYDEYCSFVESHPKFIAKPLNGQCGRGIRIIDVTHNTCEEEFQSLSKEGKWWLEELICQDARLAEWNPTSVNTVRLPTFLKDDTFTVLTPFLRVGRLGAVVDNGGSGGVFAMIDENTGEVITDGYDECGNRYICHPDSGLSFKRWNVPKWKELLRVAEECHRKYIGHKYVGWDFALTDDGWVLIEGNWGQFLSEFTEIGGVKRRFDELIGYNG